MASQKQEQVFTTPIFLAAGFFLFAVAIIEKALNLIGADIPFVPVWPRQLLDWAVVLLMFDIALTLRQVLENKLQE